MTKLRTVTGMIALKDRMAFIPITLRVTKDHHGQSISLADDNQGLMIEIPVEPVADMLEVK